MLIFLQTLRNKGFRNKKRGVKLTLPKLEWKGYYETDSKIITWNVLGNADIGYGSTVSCLAKADIEISA